MNADHVELPRQLLTRGLAVLGVSIGGPAASSALSLAAGRAAWFPPPGASVDGFHLTLFGTTYTGPALVFLAAWLALYIVTSVRLLSSVRRLADQRCCGHSLPDRLVVSETGLAERSSR